MFPDVPKLNHTTKGNFFLIAGPCVVEDEKMPMEIAEKIFRITESLEIPFIFKASYKKANRSRVDSFAGIGDKKALELIRKVGEHLNIPTLTDIHTEEEAIRAALYVDVLQIPAFLCRQTELLIAAGKTEKVINIKKGQFASASSMKFAIEKINYAGNKKVILTERGNSYGYQDLVVDFRNIPEMQRLKVPVVMDVTHSLQQPNQSAGITGGHPELIETIAKAAIACGADGIFLETHPHPATAKSDGANMLRLDLLEGLLTKLVRIRKAL
ncbi:MAG: 3-deoxy-8-phosphooctulonate synthase [Bacteroidetes bacterium]|nr:MAG: 3-deoxy-8-phosphooctulonate synthase [Bacteroidota bacterium]